MLCLQASIGAVNDLADAELDRVGKPAKPIPTGLVSNEVASAWAVLTAALGLALALPSGIPVVAVAGLGLGLGYAYDARLSRTRLAWLPLALALPLVPAFAWLGATGVFPRDLLLVAPAAVLAGAALIVANGLVDVERDRLAGKSTIPARLGRDAAWLVHAVAFAVAVAMASVLAPGPVAAGTDGNVLDVFLDLLRSIGLPLGALVIAGGAATLLAPAPAIRERGWELEGVGTAVLGLAWLARITAIPAGVVSG